MLGYEMNEYGVLDHEVDDDGERGYEVLDCEVHGREVMVMNRLIMEYMIRTQFEYCLRMVIEAIPRSFHYAITVVEEIGSQGGPWELFEKLALAVGLGGMEG